MANIRKILSFLGQYLWNKYVLIFSFLAIHLLAFQRGYQDIYVILRCIFLLYFFLFFLNGFYKFFHSLSGFAHKINFYFSFLLAFYFLQAFLAGASREVVNTFWLLIWVAIASLFILPFYSFIRHWRTHERITKNLVRNPKRFRFFKFIFSWRVFLLVYVAFWYAFFKFQFNIHLPDNPLVIIILFYLPISVYVLSLVSLHRISRFYSVPLSILGVIATPITIFYFSPDINADATFDELYRYFISLAFPIGAASVSTIILAIPGYFRLLLRKPQYFMFSVFTLLLFGYIFMVEYRLFVHMESYEKFFCSYQETKKINSPKVVRIMGSRSEGSGFFITDTMVVTNRHVVKGEDYPKVVLPSGEFLTPTKVEMSVDYDVAFLTVGTPKPDYAINLREAKLLSGEEALSFGYALGSDIKGAPTILPIRYEDLREMPNDPAKYLQFSSSIVSGMSGGPVFDKCGDFVGINVMSTSGTSLIISKSTMAVAEQSNREEPKKIKLEAGATPEDTVYAYYYLLKARETRKCYDLLSTSYKTRSTYEEWTARFPQVINVVVFTVKELKPNLVYVMFGMEEWVNGERISQLYEGTWETIREGEFYFLNRSYILELDSFYDSQGPEFFLNPEAKK